MVAYVVHIGVTDKMEVNSWMASAKSERGLKCWSRVWKDGGAVRGE